MNLTTVKNLCTMLSNTYQLGVYYFDSERNLIFFEADRKDIIINQQYFEIDRLATSCILYKETKISINNFGMAWVSIPVIVTEIVRGVIIIGPFLANNMAEETVAEALREKGLEQEYLEGIFKYIMSLPIHPYHEYIKMIKATFYYLYHEEIDESTLSSSKEQMELGSMVKSLESDWIDANKLEFHGTLTLERALMEAVRTGDIQKFMKLNEVVSLGKAGNISVGNELRQEKNLFIVTTTLVTRAAIEGGLSSEIAFTISDIYIQQVENLKSIPKIAELNTKMVLDFTRRVHELLEPKGVTLLISQACEYVKAHVYEEITLTGMASQLRISNGHLSRRFHQEMGKSITDYIKEVKVNEAQFLLKYSAYTLAEISEKLAFSSQSYFNAVFKEVTGKTPKQYKTEINQTNY